MAIGAIIAAAEVLYGLYQAYEGSQASKAEKPVDQIPEAEKRKLALMEMLAADRKLPGQDALEGKIQEVAANALKNAKEVGSPGQVLAVLSKIASKTNEANQQLGTAAAQNWTKNQLGLAGAESEMAKYQRLLYTDAYKDYLVQQNKASQLQGAGVQNILNAVGGYAAGEQSQKNWEEYLNLYKQNKTTGVSVTQPTDELKNAGLINNATPYDPNLSGKDLYNYYMKTGKTKADWGTGDIYSAIMGAGEKDTNNIDWSKVFGKTQFDFQTQ